MTELGQKRGLMILFWNSVHPFGGKEIEFNDYYENTGVLTLASTDFLVQEFLQ